MGAGERKREFAMSNRLNSGIRFVVMAVIAGAAAACATHADPAGFDAYGYLSPSPTAEGEFIGNFSSRAECEAAGDAWMSRQVVGNPVRAECFPVDWR